jgi:hypothetical protein
MTHLLPPRLLKALAGSVALAAIGLAGCEQKTEAPAPGAPSPVATAPATTPDAPGEAGEHHSSSSETLEEARAEGHREGMEMERDAHERGMEMGAKAHADGMGAKNDGSIPTKKADPPMKMDGHM